MRYFPELEEHKQGRYVLLAFSQDVCPACEQAADDDAIHVARAADIGRQDTLKAERAFSATGLLKPTENITEQPNYL